MTGELATRDGRPIAAWLFKANREVYDVEAAMEDEGLVAAWSVHQTYRVDLLAPGQPCFLYVSGTKDGRSESAIIGYGEVTGEAFVTVGEDDGHWGELEDPSVKTMFVEVEILPLAHPISRARLAEHVGLQELELLRSPQQGNPSVIRTDELEVLGSFDLSVVEPTEEQLQRLTEDDPYFILRGGEAGGFTIDLEADDTWVVTSYVVGGESAEQGRFPDFIGAVGSLAEVATQIGRSAPSQFPESELSETKLIEPLAVFSWDEDAVLSITKIDDGAFAVFEVEEPDEFEPEHLATYDDLGAAIVDVARELSTEE